MTRARVAAFTPGPPLRSGGAVYAGALLPALAERVDVLAVSPVPIEWDGPTVVPDDPEVDRCDLVLHFLADNADHAFAYRSALRRRGVVVCHELMFPHLVGTLSPSEQLAELTARFGPRTASEIRSRRTRMIATHDEACLLLGASRAFDNADAAVVHSRFAQFALEAEIPGLPVHRVPTHTAAVPHDLTTGADARAALDVPDDAFLVGLFGYLGGHKRVAEALRAFATAVPVARRRHANLRLLIVGTQIGPDVSDALELFGLRELATVVGPVDDRSFFEHMAVIDVLLNLRYPTLGETSATQVQAMRLGKPVITTDHAQFGEERAAIRVPPDENEVERVAHALVTLATCSPCRSRLAEAGRAQAADHGIDATTAAYLRVMESVLAGRHETPPRQTGGGSSGFG